MASAKGKRAPIKPPGRKVAAAASPEPRDLASLISEISGLIVTDGVVDMTGLVPEEITYAVRDLKGNRREFMIPTTAVPFPLALRFDKARERFILAQAALRDVLAEEGDEEQELAGQMRVDEAYRRLLAVYLEAVRIAQPEVTLDDFRVIGQVGMMAIINPFWVRLMDVLIRAMSGGQSSEEPDSANGDSPKAPSTTSTS